MSWELKTPNDALTGNTPQSELLRALRALFRRTPSKEKPTITTTC